MYENNRVSKWESRYKSCVNIDKEIIFEYNKKMEGTKMTSQKEIDELYLRLGISNVNNEVKRDINEGTLDNKLNVNYSSIYPDERQTIYSAGVSKEIKV